MKVARSLVGNYCTSLDMAGCSLTVTALDDELRGLVGRAGAYGGAAMVGSGRPRSCSSTATGTAAGAGRRVADGLRALGHRVFTPPRPASATAAICLGL